MLILCGITGPVSGKKSGVTTIMGIDAASTASHC
jgi:hypothetical protein